MGLGLRTRARPGSQLYTGLIGPARPGRALFVVEPDLAVAGPWHQFFLLQTIDFFLQTIVVCTY